MSELNKHIIYTAEDIKRYLGGSMTATEMHAIEMAALDDPFLAEAMEGYEIMEQKDSATSLTALKQHFNTSNSSPVIPISKAPVYKWWRTAAAIFVIGCTVATAYIFTKKETTISKETAALNELADSAIAAKPGAIQRVDDRNTDTALLLAINTTPPAGSGSIIVNSNQTYYLSADSKTATDSSFIYQPSQNQDYKTTVTADLALNTDDAGSKKEMAEAAITTYNYSPPAGNTQNAVTVDNNAAIFKQEDKSKNLKGFVNYDVNYFNGQVVTPDNKPVSFANVTVPQSKKPVYTDANGRFQVKAPDTAVKVTVASAGYNTQKFTLQSNTAGSTIVLQPLDVTTEKIASSGKSKDFAKKRMPVADSIDTDEEDGDAEPAGGWVEYNNYLNNNLVVPNEAKTNNIHGEVQVFAKLKTNGEVSQVKVAKPLCTQCDAEAIRLVKEGPKFEVKKNKTKKVKVTVKFQP